MNQADVKAKCDAAAAAIATLPIEQWPGWAVYVLEGLAARGNHRPRVGGQCPERGARR
jgi:hypothetical protein